MESEIERTGFEKLLFSILVLHGLACFMIAFPLRFIPEFRIVMQDIYVFPFENFLMSILGAVLLRKKPKDTHTRLWFLFILFLDFYRVISSFNLEFFFWTFNEVRLVLSVFFFIPVPPLFFYIVTVKFEEPDITAEQFDSLIYEEILKHENVEEGLDYVLNYIADPQWEFETGYKEDFLEYLSKRDDELGQLARDRLNPFD